MTQKSRLLLLLEKNSDPSRLGLTDQELDEASNLLDNPQYNKGNCGFCEKPSIYDTGMCQSHARYAFYRKK